MTGQAGESHRTTAFELFFDLVFVFAATRVTVLMAGEHNVHGLLQGLLLLALLWWTWEGYTWLGNQARADDGVVRGGMAVASAAVIVMALTIPEAWRDTPGGLDGPLVLVGAYVLVRATYLTVRSAVDGTVVETVAGGGEGARRRLGLSWATLLAVVPLLVAGALLGGWAQTVLFAGALAVDRAGTHLAARRGGLRVGDAARWSERHGLFVLLAIGESAVAAGVGVAGRAVSVPLLAGAVLGIAVAVCLWWLYFDVVAPAAEHRLVRALGVIRVKMVVEGYTYGHFPIVAGVIVTGLGVQGVLAHAGEGVALGGFHASVLYGGAALYLGGHVLFGGLMHGVLSLPRLLAIGALLAGLPAAIALPPLAALAGLTLVLVVLVTVETTRFAEQRRDLREA
ncbi:low temperature requirement protein A [Nonomuraea sp. LP-02]|uniref:low temperature requirement protein A n=1 Tax=Nonomuraea sp. LP-02 TaxID=3097960 RepID=UPI002E32816E|nr:low temperature requirement protein A [Nonomuraea sp. LP-02]MED7930776.1 low temperature requirement protein A [Nonomuraea sp. LP-02]